MPIKPPKPMVEIPKLDSYNESMLEKEFTEPFQIWQKDPNPTNTQNLLKAVDPVVQSAMRTFTGNDVNSPTLKSKAKLLVLDSLPRYNPARAKLRTHLMINLQGLQRATAEERQIIEVPERVRLDQYRLNTALNELTDRLGREPADSELAEYTGLSLKRITHVRKAKGSIAEGQTRSVNDEGEEISNSPAVMNRDKNEVWLRFIYADLDPKDQFIMEHVMGLHGKQILPKTEIAKRLGISSGAISQRAAKIQQMIDSKDELASNLF